MKFSKKIISELKKQRKSQKWLAEQTQISQQFLTDLLKGRRRWHEPLMDKVCAVLKIKIDYKAMG
jgi:transcriptional regulator with XRE-family HTH domain